MAPDYFVPEHALVSADGEAPEKWLHVLHGVFGSGANWRLFARKLTAACPRWGVVLVDLRGHGASQGAPPPHTLQATADDVLRLERRLGIPIGGVAGHSFGGKVALTYLERRDAPVERAFVLDASPGPRASRATGADATERVLETLESLPEPLASRERFVELALEAGHARAVTEWLAMNVRRSDDGFRLRLDLPAIRAMLDDYHAADLWSVVERVENAEKLDVILGGASDTVDPEARSRLRQLAATEPRVRLHVLERAGHWLHVDDPEGLLDVFRSALG